MHVADRKTVLRVKETTYDIIHDCANKHESSVDDFLYEICEQFIDGKIRRNRCQLKGLKGLYSRTSLSKN